MSDLASPKPRAAARPKGKERDLWALGVLPVLAVGALSGLIGVYWDIAWHIDIGRDTFFSPPHNFLYASMAIVLFVSVYGLWRDRRDSPYHLRAGSWRLHPGVVMVAVGAALVLLFAPFDELWHRLFGTDVTLWAPMHLIGLLGLCLATFGGLVSAWLERLLARGDRQHLFSLVALLFGAVLLGWITLFLAEFEFNVPQFPSFWHPLLLMGLPSFVFVLVAKLSPLPWAATVTALLYTGIRIFFAGWLMVTASLGMAGYTRPMIPVLILSALTVDFFVRRGSPAWLAGLVAGAVTLAINLPLVHLGEGIVWYGNVVMSAAVPGLVLAAVVGWAGAAVAGALKGKRFQPRPAHEPARKPGHEEVQA